MKRGRPRCARLLRLLALVGPLLLVFATACTHAAPRAFDDRLPEHLGARIALVGDTQHTSWGESLVLGRESNDAGRIAVVERIATSQPDLVVFLGDLVFDGSSASEWETFDEHCAPLHARSIPAHAIRGNHEYWGENAAGRRHFGDRFPHLRSTLWFEARCGPLAFVGLDSDLDELTDAERDAQQLWYETTLRALEADPAVRGIVALLHHPPFTNSTVVDDAEDVGSAFLPAFFAARKTLAVFSGHTHAYERFEVHGRAFVVSGGGGGPRHELLLGAARRHVDLFDGDAVRPLHFIELRVEDPGLTVQVQGLADEGTWSVLERFDLIWRR